MLKEIFFSTSRSYLSRWTTPIFGCGIEPFVQGDLVWIDGMMALQLYFAMQEDLLAEKLAWKVGEEKLSELFPNYKDGFPAVLSSSI